MLPQAKPPSLRILPARTGSALEHLNLDPVQAKNVPIFCLKESAVQTGRADDVEQSANSNAATR